MKSPANDPEALLSRIKSTFPDITWTAYKYISEGWDHEVLILDQSLVFRFPNDEEYAKLLRDEIRALKQLKPFVPTRIPEYKYIAPDNSFAGYPFIPGRPLRKALFDSFSASERTAIARQLAGLLSTMHGLVREGHDFAFVAPSDMKEQQETDKKQAKQSLRPALSPTDFTVVQEILAETDKLLAQKLPAVLIHGDIYNNHLLWDETTKQLGVIDFSDMNRGDPAFDFAELYEYGKNFVREVYSYYTGPKDGTFLDRAWTYQRWVGVFMMLDHFINHKTSFEVARETFDRVKHK